MRSRELIYQTFFSLVTSAPGIKTSGRRLLQYTEVSPPDQPALFMVQKREAAKIQTKLPTIWTLYVDLVLYGHNSGQPSVAPMSLLNPIVDSIVNILLPSFQPDDQTLGGLVHRCRVEGDIVTDEGMLGDQAIIVIPVTIYVPQ